ncbi:MAG: tRNA uridine-5-carboxymethylaminomethyl(34) synthesis GTPase MnmE [Bacilli bacterium]|nr:tRNA uridine-5-carboxymethylaminomethyl(34) synthesis GTPase MnmE [Bacilli bacterium]
MNENICAISTSLGVGAISIVRTSGPDVVSIVNKIFKGNDLTRVNTHTVNYGFIHDNGEIIDEVLVMVMRAPKTFTMEDVVEINCHGGIATTNKILELLISNGCRLAERGEFTRKAYLNGRIDLIEAEGINDLILSDTDANRKFAVSRVMGNLSKKIEDNRNILVGLQARLEVNFDYPEETDAEDMTHSIVIEELKKIEKSLKELLSSAKDGKIIKDGINVAIIGRPNVGKSSILNHLLDEKKAIVTDIAGTTRDIVEGSITIDGIKLNLIDTAGIRETDDIVEKIGVDKSKEEALNADLIILVLNNNEEISQEDLELLNINSNVNKIVFINKCDLDKKIDESKLEGNIIVRGNTIDTYGLDELKNKIKEMFNLNKINTGDYNYLSNARQIALVKNALESIENAMTSVENEVPLEMIAQDISDAYSTLGEIIGSTYKDELLDELFSKFCLGK